MLTDWLERADALAGELEASVHLGDPGWLAAVRQVPRHHLVPAFFEQTPDLGGWRRLAWDDPATRRDWAAGVYRDRTLVTLLRPRTDEFGEFPVPESSSTLPSLMVRMLDALAPADAEHVVEIGTGCGYNAALLCARLGGERVSSVDVEAPLVNAAGRRLAELGMHPALRVADGADWAPDRPFDRLIATCSVSSVPRAWLRAARPGAVLLVPLTGSLADGALARLIADGGGRASGPLLPIYAGFMPLRSSSTRPVPMMGSAPDADPRATMVDPALLEPDQPFAFLAEHHVAPLAPRRIATSADGTP